MAPSAAGQDPLCGQHIGRYVIKRQLARGGMGVVYEAVHEGIGQQAAAKVLPKDLLADPKYLESVERFVDEARALSQLHHPNIVKIFDQGQLADGTFYILMEYLAGESLSARMERVPKGQNMPLAEVLQIAQQVAAGIADAHKQGILHRDLKPSNIILVPESDAPGQVRAKIIDFGIARFTDTPYRRTTVGAILGTAAYMSPEQCRGEGVDDRSDVYALGITVFEMISGQSPFRGSGAAILAQKVMRDPAPLKSKIIGLPDQIYHLVDQLIVKDQNARPSMAQVVSRLKQLIAQHCVVLPATALEPDMTKLLPASSFSDAALSQVESSSLRGNLGRSLKNRQVQILVITVALLFSVLLVLMILMAGR